MGTQGYHHTEETKRKLSLANKGRKLAPRSEEHSRNISIALKGKYIGQDSGFFKHGLTKHPLYRKWGEIKTRCYNQNREDYVHYAGRGITVCDEWLNDPVAFIEWSLANGWQKGLYIDRIDNDKGYSPDNCRFVNNRTNCQNTRKQKNRDLPIGVYRERKRFRACIMVNGKQKYLGSYSTPESAAQAYQQALSQVETISLSE